MQNLVKGWLLVGILGYLAGCYIGLPGAGPTPAPASAAPAPAPVVANPAPDPAAQALQDRVKQVEERLDAVAQKADAWVGYIQSTRQALDDVNAKIAALQAAPSPQTITPFSNTVVTKLAARLEAIERSQRENPLPTASALQALQKQLDDHCRSVQRVRYVDRVLTVP